MVRELENLGAAVVVYPAPHASIGVGQIDAILPRDPTASQDIIPRQRLGVLPPNNMVKRVVATRISARWIAIVAFVMCRRYCVGTCVRGKYANVVLLKTLVYRLEQIG